MKKHLLLPFSLEIEPDNPENINNLGVILIAKEDYEEAINVFRMMEPYTGRIKWLLFIRI